MGFKPPRSISWRDAEKAVIALGAVFKRQTGSHKHYVIARRGKKGVVTIPLSNDINGDLLQSIIRQTGVRKKDFWKAYSGK